VSVKLTARDEALFAALGRFGIAHSSDLGRLLFPGRHRDVLAARLRRLYDSSFLEAHVLDRAAENVYSLGPRGRAWLHGRGGTVRGVPRPPWYHHLGIVSLWSGIAAATHQVEGLRLARFLPDWEIRECGSAAGLEIVPDALIELVGYVDGQPRPVRLAVELDRGTESLEVLRRKVRTIAGRSFMDWPAFDLIVLLDAAGQSREQKIRELLAREYPRQSRIWTPQSSLPSELRHLAGLAEPPATDSRYGNGMLSEPSQDSAERSGVTGEGLSGDD